MCEVPSRPSSQESSDIRNRAEVAQFVGVQDPTDGLDAALGDVEREDVDEAPVPVGSDGPGLPVDFGRPDLHLGAALFESNTSTEKAGPSEPPDQGTRAAARRLCPVGASSRVPRRRDSTPAVMDKRWTAHAQVRG